MIVFGSRMLSLKICPFYLIQSKIVLKQIGLQVPALDNLKCCKTDWCLQVQFAPGKFGTLFELEIMSIPYDIFSTSHSRMQDSFQVKALDNFKVFIERYDLQVQYNPGHLLKHKFPQWLK